MKDKWLRPTSLFHQKVDLEPLATSHREDLLKAAADGQLWNLWFTSVPSEKTIDAYISAALNEAEAGNGLPFVVIEQETGKIIGSTRFCNATPEFRRVEIGYTWYAKSYQKTGINSASKYLLLKYAFEELNAIAVEFKTHWFNYASRAAILRLGAKQDGVLRNHRFDADGILRDTVVFSIINQEWPAIKKNLEYGMQAYR